MKNFTLACLVVLLAAEMRGQAYLGVSWFSIDDVGAQQDRGHGWGLNFFSKYCKIGKADRAHKLALQVGGEVMRGTVAQKKFENVPLVSYQKGVSTVTLSNKMMVADLLARFSLLSNSSFTPYLQIGLGYRRLNSDLLVSPNMQAYGSLRQEKSHESLALTQGLNYVVGGGVNIELSERFSVLAGLNYMVSFAKGNEIEMNSAYCNKDGLYANVKNATKGFTNVQVGLVYCFNHTATTIMKTSENNVDGQWYVEGTGPVRMKSTGYQGNRRYWPGYGSGTGRQYGSFRGASGGGGGAYGNSAGSFGTRSTGGHIGTHIGGKK